MRHKGFLKYGLFLICTNKLQTYVLQVDPSPDGHVNGTFENAEKKIAIHTKIMEEYLKKINSSHETEQSINWVTHQKCHDMLFPLGLAFHVFQN